MLFHLSTSFFTLYLQSAWTMVVQSQGLNRAYAGLRHAIVITTKPRFVLKRTCNTEVRHGGDNNSLT